MSMPAFEHSEGCRSVIGSLEGTWALGYLMYSGTGALRSLRYLGFWALRALRHLGT